MKKLGIILLCIVMVMTCVISVASAGDIDTSKKIKKLEVEKEPDKVYYEVGEEFTLEAERQGGWQRVHRRRLDEL